MKKILVRVLAIAVLISTFAFTSCTDQYGYPLQGNGAPGTTPLQVTGNTSITQNVVADPNNSSIVVLGASGNFTGTATSTLGIVGIQVSLKTDKDCTVYIEQSPTNGGTPNWDIIDTYKYTASLGGNSWTVQAVNSYFRVVVVNKMASPTSYFRLQSCLCPIVEAVPRSLSSDGRLKTQNVITDEYGFDVEATPFNELRVAESVKLSGTVFIGTVLDNNFIATNTTGTGTVTQGGGMMTLSTGTGANGYAEALTQRRARFVAGNCNMAKLVIQMNDGVADNIRRWGIGDVPGALPQNGNYTLTDGAFFSENGSTFAVATMKSSVPTIVNSGAFNGEYGTTYVLDNNVHIYEIYYSPYAVYFTVDGTLLHTVLATSTTWSNTVTLYTGMDNTNFNGSTTNVVMNCWGFSIHRYGPLVSSPVTKHLTAGTSVLKYGAGTLHSVNINTTGASSSSVTIYDNTSVNVTSTIAVISGPNNSYPFAMPYNLDFSTGLTVVVTGSYDVTVVYE